MPRTHSAMIYFHGVGDPRRHVSLGSFLDHFGLYGQRQDAETAGRPRSFSYASEVFDDDDDVTSFVEFKRIVSGDGGTRVARIVRVYEAYWVPAARSSFTVAATLAWLAGRILSPVRVLVSPWRSFPAIRLLGLFRLAETYPKPGHLVKLERFYRDFENWENRGRYPAGSYREFKKFVEVVGKADERERLLLALAAWRRSARNLAWRQLGRLALALGFPVALVALVMPLTGIAESSLHDRFPWFGVSPPSMLLVSAVLTVALVLLLTYLIARTYIFDVISWTLESERSAQYPSRERVIRYSQELIRKVAAHPECTDITIVSHSLGSCIATEALLREGARDKAFARRGHETTLGKVRSVFTVGSPLDLIFFFFQADRTFSHRYNRIEEERRPSISLPPFWIGGMAGSTRIYNAWSRFDPISSPMHALRKRLSERRNAIVNVEVLPENAPSPLGSHVSYFSDPNLMSAIYSSVMHSDVVLDERGPVEFVALHPLMSRAYWARSLILPAVGLLGVVPASPLFEAAGCVGAILAIGFAMSRTLRRDYQLRFGRYLDRGKGH